MKNLWVLNQTPSRTLKVPACPEEKYIKEASTRNTVQAEPVMMYTRYRREQIKEASTRITVRAEQVMMYTRYRWKSTKVHPRNDAKYESKKKKTKPGIQP